MSEEEYDKYRRQLEYLSKKNTLSPQEVYDLCMTAFVISTENIRRLYVRVVSAEKAIRELEDKTNG